MTHTQLKQVERDGTIKDGAVGGMNYEHPLLARRGGVPGVLSEGAGGVGAIGNIDGNSIADLLSLAKTNKEGDSSCASAVNAVNAFDNDKASFLEGPTSEGGGVFGQWNRRVDEIIREVRAVKMGRVMRVRAMLREEGQGDAGGNAGVGAGEAGAGEAGSTIGTVCLTTMTGDRARNATDLVKMACGKVDYTIGGSGSSGMGRALGDALRGEKREDGLNGLNGLNPVAKDPNSSVLGFKVMDQKKRIYVFRRTCMMCVELEDKNMREKWKDVLKDVLKSSEEGMSMVSMQKKRDIIRETLEKQEKEKKEENAFSSGGQKKEENAFSSGGLVLLAAMTKTKEEKEEELRDCSLNKLCLLFVCLIRVVYCLLFTVCLLRLTFFLSNLKFPFPAVGCTQVKGITRKLSEQSSLIRSGIRSPITPVGVCRAPKKPP